MQISYSDWQQWSKTYNRLPVICEMDWPDGLPLSWEKFWDEADPYSFVLESGRTGRYTYVGIRPSAVLSGIGMQAEERVRVKSLSEAINLEDVQDAHGFDTAAISNESCYRHARTFTGRPLDVVREWMSNYRAPSLEARTGFTGGCVGVWGYDVVRSLEKLPNLAERDLNVPDYAFMLIDECWIYDHQRRTLTVCVYEAISREMTNDAASASKLLDQYERARQKARTMISKWQEWARAGHEAGLKRKQKYEQAVMDDGLHIDLEQGTELKSSLSKQAFTQAVTAIQDYIRAGDVFQVNLSVRQDRKTLVKPEVLYEWLRLLNPSPYMGLLRFADVKLVSASPELLIKQQGRTISTRPIAGTRRRGQTPTEDARLEEELRTNEKERAEHIMLVDLERNDIGRAAKFGSVRVDQFMTVERYSHVMHLVSEVSGELRDELDGFDALAAVFPGGTITGAPKIRTMEIIEELEPVRRGFYTGSFGWIDYSGDMEFNIIIRTLLSVHGHAYVQAGAGIVIDSIPEREYKESLSKAKALWKALQYAERLEAESSTLTPEHKGEVS